MPENGDTGICICGGAITYTDHWIHDEEIGNGFPEHPAMPLPTELNFGDANPALSFACVCGEPLSSKMGVAVKCPKCGKKIMVKTIPEEVSK